MSLTNDFVISMDRHLHNLSVASKLASPDAKFGGDTVTSVNVSGGKTGLNVTGGPITDAGTLTLGGTLLPDNGGTGLSGIGTNGQVLNVDYGVPPQLQWSNFGTAAGVEKDIQLAGSSEDFVSASTVSKDGVFTYTPTNTPRAIIHSPHM